MTAKIVPAAGPVLIIASEQDDHVPLLTPRLDALGVDHVRFDPASFPVEACLSMRLGEPDDWSLQLVCDSRAIDLHTVRSVWFRGRSRPTPHADADPAQVAWIAESCARFLAEMYECMDCLWLPERPGSDREPFRPTTPRYLEQGAPAVRAQVPSPHNKMYQLKLARRLGFDVPRTLITNNPDEFLDFYTACEGRVIAKRATNLLPMRDGALTAAHTTIVTRRDLAHHRAVRHEPVALQEQIAKKLELRVTVVGDQVFPVAIDSQLSHRREVDRGHHADYGGEGHHVAYRLPDAIAVACRQIMAALGLCYGAIDIILTPDDRYVFLEVNPNGQWAFLEIFTAIPISDAVVRLLVEGKCAHPAMSQAERPARRRTQGSLAHA